MMWNESPCPKPRPFLALFVHRRRPALRLQLCPCHGFGAITVGRFSETELLRDWHLLDPLISNQTALAISLITYQKSNILKEISSP